MLRKRRIHRGRKPELIQNSVMRTFVEMLIEEYFLHKKMAEQGFKFTIGKTEGPQSSGAIVVPADFVQQIYSRRVTFEWDDKWTGEKGNVRNYLHEIVDGDGALYISKEKGISRGVIIHGPNIDDACECIGRFVKRLGRESCRQSEKEKTGDSIEKAADRSLSANPGKSDFLTRLHEMYKVCIPGYSEKFREGLISEADIGTRTANAISIGVLLTQIDFIRERYMIEPSVGNIYGSDGRLICPDFVYLKHKTVMNDTLTGLIRIYGFKTGHVAEFTLEHASEELMSRYNKPTFFHKNGGNPLVGVLRKYVYNPRADRCKMTDEMLVRPKRDLGFSAKDLERISHKNAYK